MPGGKSDYLENLILNMLLGAVDPPAWGAAYTPPSTLYVGLFNVMPSDAGTGGTEVSGTGYARVAVTNNTTNFPSVTNGLKKNGTAITFPTPGGSWGTVVGFGIYDAATSGNLWYYGTLSASREIAANQVVRFNANALQIGEE